MKLAINAIAVTAAILLSAATATAVTTVVYDNGLPDFSLHGFLSDFDGSALGGPQQNAEAFTLDSDTTITDVHWYGFYRDAMAFSSTPSDDFTIRFFADDGSGDFGSYGGALNTPFHVAAGLDVDRSWSGNTNILGIDVYEYSTFIDPVDLGTTPVWLSVVNNTVGATSMDWVWQRTEGDDEIIEWRSADEQVFWFQDEGNLSFSLTSTTSTSTPGTPPIPEPATAALGLLGIAALGLHLRRRRVN